jgi:exonuclease SbcD
MIKILHFADAHIDLARQGRHDPESGLPLRVLDFLKSLDTIVDTAIDEKVDLVVFAGDAYRDRTPAPPTSANGASASCASPEPAFKPLWCRQPRRFSGFRPRQRSCRNSKRCRCPMCRDQQTCLLKPADLGGLPLQVIGIPWLNRSGLAAAMVEEKNDTRDLISNLEENLPL